MKAKEYIESGILELYVAGSLSDKESREVTTMLKAHPEIKEAVEEIENAFIAFAASQAPAKAAPLDLPTMPKQQNPDIPRINPGWRSYGLAAALLLLIGSIILNLLQFNRIQETSQELAELQSEKLELAGDYDRLQANFQTQTDRFQVLRSPETVEVQLAGTAVSPESLATVYWNQSSQKVFVDISALPAPPEGKEYQLWSLTSLDPLTPMDAGVLTNYSTNDDKIFNAKLTSEAVAFAITLEPAGGSASPTLEQLYVLGTV